MKIQSKYKLLKSRQVEHLFNEIQIMSEINHPYVLNMKGVAQDKRIMYMYVDYMKHGNLVKVLNQFLFERKSNVGPKEQKRYVLVTGNGPAP